MVLAGDFPEVVAGLDGVEFFLGFFGRGSRCGGLEGGSGLEDEGLGEEALGCGGVVVGFGEGFAGEGVEAGGGSPVDCVGAWGGEEFFGELLEVGGRFAEV